ncbi:MAG TPA: phosphate acyltransferase [Anaeromyxobacteraceae bacterium]|nr:phosphate acyltransferase [Anaeromyxobacteraceae bacterium]
MIRKPDALRYHAGDRPGKVEVKATKPCLSPRDIRLAYLPGATFPASEIAADPAASYLYTSRGNLVGVVTNGTAVPGVGAVGAAAAKPVQEGIGVLFKTLADIDVFDLEIDADTVEEFTGAVRRLEPTFGGVNLKDIRAPEGLAIYDRLVEAMRIPVFHENLYGTAVVATAALINALELAGKKLHDVRVVICGAGTVGLGCARLIGALGLPPENLLLYDVHGLVHPERGDLSAYQRAFARLGPRTLAEGVAGADVLLGAATGGAFDQAMIRSMAPFPVVIAMAMPDPEIAYQAARAVRRDVIVATSDVQSPNAIVDLLSFPYIFRGALDVHASRISIGMMLAAARALADLAREEVTEEVSRAYDNAVFTFGPEYLLPKPIDQRILLRESRAVAQQAVTEGLARVRFDVESYEGALAVRLGTGREVMRRLIVKARGQCCRLALPDGTQEATLRACRMLVDDGIASPILIGREEAIRAAAQRLGHELEGTTIVDPQRSPRFDAYVQEYLRLRARRGATPDLARARLADPVTFATLMVHLGDADMLIGGAATHYAEPMRKVLEIIGPAPGVRRVASLHMVLRPKTTYFMSDCAVNIAPQAEDLAEIALLAAGMVRTLGIEPRVAMLSFSNYGGSEHPLARKVRRATAIARERAPDLVVDGEIQLFTALDEATRGHYFPHSELHQNANLLVFPDLQAGSLALNLLQKLGDALAVGPVLTGTRRPFHILQHGASAEDLVNVAVVGVVQAAEENKLREVEPGLR